MAELAALLYRFPLVNLLLVLIATGAVGCGLIIVFMAQSLLRPPRLTDGKALYLSADSDRMTWDWLTNL